MDLRALRGGRMKAICCSHTKYLLIYLYDNCLDLLKPRDGRCPKTRLTSAMACCNVHYAHRKAPCGTKSRSPVTKSTVKQTNTAPLNDEIPKKTRLCFGKSLSRIQKRNVPFFCCTLKCKRIPRHAFLCVWRAWLGQFFLQLCRDPFRLNRDTWGRAEADDGRWPGQVSEMIFSCLRLHRVEDNHDVPFLFWVASKLLLLLFWCNQKHPSIFELGTCWRILIQSVLFIWQTHESHWSSPPWAKVTHLDWTTWRVSVPTLTLSLEHPFFIISHFTFPLKHPGEESYIRRYLKYCQKWISVWTIEAHI